MLVVGMELLGIMLVARGEDAGNDAGEAGCTLAGVIGTGWMAWSSYQF
jgi:hypothetical protein